MVEQAQPETDRQFVEIFDNQHVCFRGGRDVVDFERVPWFDRVRENLRSC
jgi:hypothetical protein